ncbi:MAG: molybdopterin cofactor-binding domain-containing protein [Bacteroidota bacterium]
MGKWTRRAFITAGVLTGGAVIFGIAIRPGNRARKVAETLPDKENSLLNIWVKLSPDNTITAIVPHAEMGQGTHTALAMMLADEMDADWELVRMEEAPAHKEYANYALIKGFVAGDVSLPTFLEQTADGLFLTLSKRMNFQITGGSSAVSFTGKQAMRVAGAAAKSMLLQAAANAWKVPVNELSAAKSVIYHKASNRSAPYADFAKEAVALDAPDQPTLKSREAFTIMGTSPIRLDIPGKVTGEAVFGMDVQLPNMTYATIQQPPVFGSKIASFDASKAEGMTGVHKVLQIDEAVAVIADGYWQAKQALARVKIEYGPNEQQKINSADIFDRFRKGLDESQTNGKGEEEIDKGDVATSMESAHQTIEAEYEVPYLAHATMEPMNCTAWVKEDGCEIWIGSQNPLGVTSAVAEVLDIESEQVIVHNQYLGGGFGRRAENDVVIQAVKLAQSMEGPVKMIWSREEDMRQDVYRDANVSRFKGGLDEQGNPVAWENLFNDKHHPGEASHIPYAIPNQSIQYTKTNTHIPWGNWRSVDHSLHGFFTESFIDELAVAAGKDPFEFRRDLLSEEPRLKAVLELAAEKADWGTELPENWGRGIAIQQSFGTIVAEVVEVEVVGEKLTVHRVVCAADPGFAVYPDAFVAQMESGIMYGLSAALHGEITIENGAVKESNFHDYEILRMDEAPAIETHIITSDNAPGGAGEPSTPGIAPALANAIFDATQKRIRSLPVGKQMKGELLAGRG